MIYTRSTLNETTWQYRPREHRRDGLQYAQFRCEYDGVNVQEFLNIALGFPTIFWTILMGIVMAYWLFVILGALDIELLDFDIDLETDLDLDFDVDLDADLDLDADVDGGVDADVATASPLMKVAVALGIGRVPITILLSFFALSGWAVSYFGTLYLTSVLKGGIVGALVLGLAFVIAIPLMGAMAHPLKGLFETHTRRAGAEVIGKVCVITTGSVDERFGQAKLDDEGAGLLLDVRCETEENGLQRHSEALIIGHDRETNVYFVEPYEQFLASGTGAEAGSSVDAAQPVGQSVNAKREG